jgi:hypothetical protein
MLTFTLLLFDYYNYQTLLARSEGFITFSNIEGYTLGTFRNWTEVLGRGERSTS